MRRVTKIDPAAEAASVVATVTLAYDQRHRRRFRMTDDGGEPFLLDLADARLLGDGDGLVIEGGGVIRVRAAAEAVLDITGKDAAHAALIAWHLGNRHCPVQVLDGGALRIRDDHVLAEMAAGLGAEVRRRRAPFAPAPGAYAGRAGHQHG